MDLKIIKNAINNYFKELLTEYQVPIGYHDLKVIRNNSIINITLDALTDDSAINVIPKIEKRFSIVLENLVTILRNLDLDHDFLFESIEFTTVKLTFKVTEFESYLNLHVIPVELISEVIKYLGYRDYFKLLEVLKIKKYSSKEIINNLKVEYFIKNEKDLFALGFQEIVTIDALGNPINIKKILINGVISEERVSTLKGEFISGKIWKNNELVEAVGFNSLPKGPKGPNGPSVKSDLNDIRL